MAMLAGKRRHERLNAPPDPDFPPITVDNINKLRLESKQGDARLQFFFARYLLYAVDHLRPNAQDPERARQLRDHLTSEAIHMLKKLASYKLGYPDAQFFLANGYGGGLYGLKPDLDKAFSLYLQGSKQNHPESIYRVAVCYELGLGTKKDHRYAMQFYRKAANASDPSSMYKLGLILLNGLLGQSKNPKEAVSWFLRASQVADEDHPQPLHELGLAYERQQDPLPSILPDLDYARELFSQAAQLGYAPSQYKLGLAYEHGYLNCPVDPRRSIAWYSRAAEQQDASAELALSGWYLTGAENILVQDDQEAYLWARKAADRGLAKARYAVGYYVETGVGVPQNLEEAKQWYMKAAQQGDIKAKQRLQVLDQSNPIKRRPTRDKNGKPKDSDCRLM
ncbi:uncharacterized protein B0P05DRAFT_535652 [Gilbertella persicaria]|uniref:uncharacterized protein n=1 Tax=Gilbertella persicaria TaxID=101096 RepID=UPI00221F3265|nr:uncharacterized protein B0P05DRAFT_535652 [Gilbertella persicaria]KAI8083969.1 hypothetical protein B0P05DRAFT_535652 [Gilbertella persicaria]